ncbi:MAG: hypothetical protein AAF432_10430 [Planctomycetota bacterium]
MVKRHHFLRLFVLAAATIVGGAIADSAWAREVIKPSSRPLRWELDFEPGDLRLFVDQSDGSTYLYFTYKVTNNTGQDRTWAPSFILYTDTGEIMKSGEGVPGRLNGELIDLLGNEFLEPQFKIIGDLFQGEGMAREGIVVWPIRDITINELKLFVAGVSGETARTVHPVTKAPIILRKTMQRNYILRGNALARGSKPAELVSTTWVMR